MTLPILYNKEDEKIPKKELFFTGIANAIGPHIPMQWKLPKKPSDIASNRNILINFYNTFIIVFVIIRIPINLHFVQAFF